MIDRSDRCVDDGHWKRTWTGNYEGKKPLMQIRECRFKEGNGATVPGAPNRLNLEEKRWMGIPYIFQRHDTIPDEKQRWKRFSLLGKWKSKSSLGMKPLGCLPTFQALSGDLPFRISLACFFLFEPHPVNLLANARSSVTFYPNEKVQVQFGA